jgi:hypothetical protein
MRLLHWAVPTVTRRTRPGKWPSPLDTFDPRVKNRGRALGLTGRRWLARIRRLQAARCSGEGSGSKPTGRWTRFGAVEGRGLTKEACPWWRGTTVGEEGWQAGVVVAGGVGVVGEELLGDAKLRV